MNRRRTILLWLLSINLMVVGFMHLLRPEFFVAIIPSGLPNPEWLNVLSGLAEIVIGVFLLDPRSRWIAAYAAIALFIAVFPANIYAALENVAGAIVAALRDATRENFRYRPEDVLAGDVEGVKLEAIALSCAGVDDDDGKARWRDALASLCVAVPPRRVVVANDAAAALASGTRGRLHGVVLISGTGTIAAGGRVSHQIVEVDRVVSDSGF